MPLNFNDLPATEPARQIPQWLVQASQADRDELKARWLESHRQARRLREALAPLLSLKDFTLPLLEPLLDELGHPGMNLFVPRFHCTWYVPEQNDFTVGPNPVIPVQLPEGGARGYYRNLSRSVLEAAIVNFPSASGYDLDRQQYRLEGAPGFPFEDFFQAVRRLDIGQHYQAYLSQALSSAALEAAWQSSDLSTLRYDALEAVLSGAVSEQGYAMLANVGVPPRQDGVVSCTLRGLWYRQVPMQGCLVVTRAEADADGIYPVVLYVPGAPDAPLVEYPSLSAAADGLLERMATPAVCDCVTRKLPIHERGVLLDALASGDRAGIRRAVTLPDLGQASLAARFTQWRESVRRHALQVAVPTAVYDTERMLAAWQQYWSIGQQVLFGFAMLVPGSALLGGAAMVVGSYGFVSQIYNGIHLLEEHEVDQAVGELFGALQAAVQAGAGAVLEHLPVGSAFSGHTEPFQEGHALPAEAERGSDGLYRLGAQQWVVIDEKPYPVDLEQGHPTIKAPPGNRLQRPALERMPHGKWCWVHDSPRQWSGARLLRSLEQGGATLSDERLVRLQALAQVSDEQLRYALLNGTPLPASLGWSLERATALEAAGQQPLQALLLVLQGQGRTVTDQPLAQPLLHQFPTLPASFAEQIVSDASAVERARLASGRVPASLGAAAAHALRTVRIARAMLALEQGLPTPDRDLLLIGAAQRLQAWPQALHVELEGRQRPAQPEGGSGLVLRVSPAGQGYVLAGGTPGLPMPLEQLLLDTLPAQARGRWAADSAVAIEQMREQAAIEVVRDPVAARRDLGLRPEPGSFTSPRRYGQRLGYALSGRAGQRWLNPQVERLRALYPTLPEERLRSLLDQFNASDRGADLEIAALEQDLRVLRRTLDEWRTSGIRHEDELTALAHLPEIGNAALRGEDGAPSALALATLAEHRRAFANRLVRAWQRGVRAPDGSTRLDLSGLAIGRLPVVLGRFDHVSELRLSNMQLTQVDGYFLACFENIDSLYLGNNRLTAVPDGLSSLHRLRFLSLRDLPLADTPQAFAALGPVRGISPIGNLNLSGSVATGALEPLRAVQRLRGLRSLSLDDNTLDQAQLAQLAAMHYLQGLSLDHVGLRAEQVQQLIAPFIQLRYLSLARNRFRQAPHFDAPGSLMSLDLSDNGMAHIPEVVYQIIRSTTQRTVDINLSDNLISEPGPLAELTLERRQAGVEVTVDLDDNPFTHEAAESLRASGIACMHRADQWFTDQPRLVRAVEHFRERSRAADRTLELFSECAQLFMERGEAVEWLEDAIVGLFDATDIIEDNAVGNALEAADRQRMIRQAEARTSVYYLARLGMADEEFHARLGALRERVFANAVANPLFDLRNLRNLQEWAWWTASEIAAFLPALSIRMGEPDTFNGLLNHLYGHETTALAFSRELMGLSPVSGEVNPLRSVASLSRCWEPYLRYGAPEWQQAEALWDRLQDWAEEAASNLEQVATAGLNDEQLATLRQAAANGIAAGNQGNAAAGAVIADIQWPADRGPVHLSEGQYNALYRGLASAREAAFEALGWMLTQRYVQQWWPR